MPDLKKLRNLKQALSTELERRPIEERERLTAETKKRRKLVSGWERQFPWFPVSDLTPRQRKEFLERLEDAEARMAVYQRQGLSSPAADHVPSPHIAQWRKDHEKRAIEPVSTSSKLQTFRKCGRPDSELLKTIQ